MAEITVLENPNVLNDSEISFEERAKQLEEERQREKEKQERKKKSAYDEWTQLNLDSGIVKRLMELSENQNAMKLFFFIIKHMDRMNALVCSYSVFQEQLGMSRATVARAINFLKEKDVIHIKKSGTSNVYLLDDDITWKNHGDKRRYCQFHATVLLSESEQEEQTNKKLKDRRYTHIEME